MIERSHLLFELLDALLQLGEPAVEGVTVAHLGVVLGVGGTLLGTGRGLVVWNLDQLTVNTVNCQQGQRKVENPKIVLIET